MKLQLDIAACVRAQSKFATCTRCADACEEVRIIEHLPSFRGDVGLKAAMCVGACPTEAFWLEGFLAVDFFFDFLQSGGSVIARGPALPCLSLLSVEHWISLALASAEPLMVDFIGYELDTPPYVVTLARIEEANFILSSFGDKQIGIGHSDVLAEVSDAPAPDSETSRRAFLENLSLKGAIRQKQAFDVAVSADEWVRAEWDEGVIARLKQKRIPQKRKLLFTMLKRTSQPERYEVIPEAEIGFVSQKYVEESCTNCQICYRICPTGALGSDQKFSLIYFDAMLCVKCRLCHDVCEPDAIGLQDGFEIREFFEPSQRELIRFAIKRCHECGNPFTYRGGEQICPRCQVEEEEALRLHQNAKEQAKRS
jgi:energy-converting hydrogenase A subunit P